MLPTESFGFLVIFAVFTAGLSSTIPGEFKDVECRSCFNQTDLIKYEDLRTRHRRSTEVKRTLESKMYEEDCSRIGTIGVGETYKLDVRNSQAADNVPIPRIPNRETDFKEYLLSIMCPEDACVEVEHTFEDQKLEKDTFVFDCAKSEPRIYHAPSLSRHVFSIKNVAGTKNKKKIMFKLQATSKKCDESKIWQEEQHRKKKHPFAEKLNKYIEGDELSDPLNKITSILSNIVPIPGLSSVVDIIWPYGKLSEWDKSIKEVSAHIKNATIKQNLMASKQRLQEVEISIQNLEKIRNSKPTGLQYYIHFAQVSEKLLTEQVHFQFDDLESNLAALPLLTATMSLILKFYSEALKDPLYKMNDEWMKTVQTTRTTILENVNKHILRVYEDQITSAFNNCDEENLLGRTQMYLYDCVVDAHNLVAMQGLKFLNAWNKLSHFQSNDTRTIHVPIYSHYFGRPTTGLIRDLYLSNTISLLTPPVYDLTGCYGNSPNPTCFYRKRVTSILINDADHIEHYQIANIIFMHDNEDSGFPRYYYKYDYQSYEVPKGVYIKKIRAGVSDKLRYVEFYLTDDSIIAYGLGADDKSIPQTIFELPDHHIADILVKSDDQRHYKYGDAAYGISVSYLPNPVKNH